MESSSCATRSQDAVRLDLMLGSGVAFSTMCTESMTCSSTSPKLRETGVHSIEVGSGDAQVREGSFDYQLIPSVKTECQCSCGSS